MQPTNEIGKTGTFCNHSRYPPLLSLNHVQYAPAVEFE
jgi:hypothetical protein